MTQTPSGAPEKGENTRCEGPESRYLSDQMLNAMGNCILLMAADGTIRRANTQAYDGLHLDDKIIGRKISDLLTITHQGRNILPEVLGALTPENDQYRLPDQAFVQTEGRDAHLFVRGQFTLLTQNEPEVIFVFQNMVDDLTREFMLKMALSSTKIFPWFYDMERDTMIIDSRYFEYTGIPTVDNSMTLQEFADRLHPEDRPMMARAFEQQLNGVHYPYPVPYRLKRGDGSWEWFEGQSTYMGKVEGLPFRVVGICMSTQAHKDIEEALISARNKAEQSDRLKSAFLANMSHEIRTPLNAIVGFSNLLTGGDVSVNRPEAQEFVALINKNCNHLLTLISDILDLARIESDTMEYSCSEQSLNGLLADIYRNHRPTMPQNVAFELSLPAEDTLIETDPARVRQIVDNLLTNAAKFTSRGRIELGYTRNEKERSVSIHVEDTGCGIPDDQLEKVFERFHKVDSFVQGAGLGLSICKTIAEHLGGSISLTSRIRQGSRFTLRLPLRP